MVQAELPANDEPELRQALYLWLWPSDDDDDDDNAVFDRHYSLPSY